ncbi:hypothetical protein WH47_01114 [Habropoda laboriosa]|uniref:Uncharacterized protein n=1 Tax=Habropoda laboriosa TaxID=597456 RepID=A0A0L7QYS9_9HYME|nr:hypothetical protein WH47_01114 [Habropoda laboriosa]
MTKRTYLQDIVSLFKMNSNSNSLLGRECERTTCWFEMMSISIRLFLTMM